MNLAVYLNSKKIDADAFKKAEPSLWQSWSDEFEQMHPNSFTVQKLNLLNPIRRKYPLKTLPVEERTATPPPETPATSNPAASPNPKPSIPKPVFKPKPKMS